MIQCSSSGCEAGVKNDRWNKTRAEGWFFQKTGEAWCADHTPEWVASWRERRAKSAKVF